MQAVCESGCELKRTAKEIWKNLKKVLDKCKILWYSKRANRESEQRTLYLVNWIMQRQTITPWTIIMDCLSVFRNEFITANENSWVYLLDKFIQNFDLSPSGFRYNFLRVWSWLRTNAGGVPNTCKSNGALRCLVANGWVTREEPAFQWGTTVGNDC